MSGSDRAARPFRIRTVVLVTLGVLAALVAAAVWVGVRGVLAARELSAAMPLADRLQVSVEAGDIAGVQALSAEIDERAGSAVSLTGDPLWRAAELMPGLGPNLSAMRVASDALHTLSGDVVGPLAQIATAGTATGGGPLDLSVVRAAQQPLAHASAEMARVSGEMDAVPTGALLSPLRSGMNRLSAAVDDAGDMLGPLSRAAQVLPGVLGSDGPKTVLLMVQNSAELRTGGGITGTFVELRADAGSIMMVDQSDATQFPILPSAIVTVPDTLGTLYGDITGRFVQDSSVPADFSLTGQLAAAWWAQRTGAAPDAVVSIDPIVLRALVGATGPLVLRDGTDLTADNLVQKLLVEPYLVLDSDQQTGFFAEATRAVMDRLFSGALDPITWVRALADPVREGRVSMWSADPDVQAKIVDTPLGGPAARQRGAGENAYAVYFNDATGGKLDTFMTTGISTGVASCRADGRREVVVSVTLTSNVPSDAEQRFPGDMTGEGRYHVAIGDIGMVVAVSAPVGSYYGGVRKDGEPLAGVDGEDAGFPVSLARVNLQPGETNTLEFRFLTDRTDDFAPVLLHTPMLDAPTITTAEPACR